MAHLLEHLCAFLIFLPPAGRVALHLRLLVSNDRALGKLQGTGFQSPGGREEEGTQHSLTLIRLDSAF